jgi:YD repeat-containing protein
MGNESDREKVGLRGPVKTCVEEINFPGVTLPDGTKIPERWDAHTTDYDVDGRLLANRGPNSDGSEWITAQSYDADGRLTKIVSDGTPWPGTEVLYSYDGAGRLVTIANSLQPGDRTEFHYDAQGRKTAVQKFDTRTLQRVRNASYCGSLWDAAVNMGIGVPDGGSIITLYDGNDPTEAQIQDSKGRIVTRLIRTYDANRRIQEEKQIQENPALLMAERFSSEKQVELTDAQLEAMNAAMKLMLSGQNGTGISYVYDGKGRVIEMREGNFAFTRVTTTRYNEQGDKADELTNMAGNSVFPVGVVHSIDENGTLLPSNLSSNPPISLPIPEESSVRYSYQYDSYSNWIEQTADHRSGPDGAFQSSTGRRRSLRYY